MLHSIFALELCGPFETGSRFHEQLRDLLKQKPEGMGFQAKWAFYRRITDLLLDQMDRFERGCWDFFDDDERARRDFEMWSNGMFEKESPRETASGVPDAYRGDPRYLTFTMAFLLIQNAPSERILATRCNIPKDSLWKRDVFRHIVNGIPYVNFASVKGDVVYLIPRDDDWGLTKEDLDAPKFEYLRAIT